MRLDACRIRVWDQRQRQASKPRRNLPVVEKPRDDRYDLADRMRARKQTARAELKGHPEIPAETHTFEGDNVDFALADEPMDDTTGSFEGREMR